MVVEMPMKWHERSNERLIEWMTDWLNESIKELNDWMNEQWMSESTKERTNGWVSNFFTETLLRWGTFSLSYFFSLQPLIWATSSLTRFCLFCSFGSPILLFAPPVRCVLQPPAATPPWHSRRAAASALRSCAQLCPWRFVTADLA